MRPARLIIALAAVGTLAACSSGPAAAEKPAARSTAVPVASSPPSIAEVTAHLLKPRDLPSGWTEEPVGGQSPTDTRLCNAGNPPQPETERTAIFDSPSGAGQIAENLYGLASPAQASAAYAFEIAHATCATYTTPNNVVTLTLASLPFPAEGQQSRAWKATIKENRVGITDNGDVILVQDGPYDLALIDRAIGHVDGNLLRATLQKALAEATS